MRRVIKKNGAARGQVLARPFCVAWLAGALGVSTLAHAQMGANVLSSSPPDLSAGQAEGERGEAGPKRFLSLEPSLAVDGEWSNNIRLQSGSAKTSDFVTTVRPGIRFLADGDRLKASVDYSLSRLFHARDHSLDRNQNNLNANGSYEMVDDFAFIDFSGNISQQTISAFGPRSDNDVAFNANRTEVATYRLSPHVRGQFGDWANYQARYSRMITRTKSGGAFDYDMDEFSGVLSGTSQLRSISWSLDLSRQNLDYSSGRSFEADRIRAFLTYPFTPQFSVAVIPGWESNNYASQEKDSRATIGARANWIVSERTNLSALVEKRFFGQAHSFSFEHRTPRTAWRASDSKDATMSPNQLGAVSLGPLYDLLFFQFSSVEPDPVRRAQLVQSFLLANGLNGNTNVNLGFLTSAVSLARRQDLSFTLLGVRDTLTFMASRSESSRLMQGIDGSDDLANSMFVRATGLSLLYSHRLTPESTLTVLAAQSKSSGEMASTQGSKLKTLNVSLSTRLGKHTTGSLGLRRSISDGNVFSYTESAVRGGLSVQF